MALSLISIGAGILFWYEPDHGPNLFSGLGLVLVYGTGVALILLGGVVFLFGFFRADRALEIEQGLNIPGPIHVPENPCATTLGRLLESPGAPDEADLLVEFETLLENPTHRTYIFRLIYQRLDRVSSAEVARCARKTDPPADLAGAKVATTQVALSVTNTNPALTEVFEQAFGAAVERVTKVVAEKLLAEQPPRHDDPRREAALAWKQVAKRLARPNPN